MNFPYGKALGVSPSCLKPPKTESCRFGPPRVRSFILMLFIPFLLPFCVSSGSEPELPAFAELKIIRNAFAGAEKPGWYWIYQSVSGNSQGTNNVWVSCNATKTNRMHFDCFSHSPTGKLSLLGYYGSESSFFLHVYDLEFGAAVFHKAFDIQGKSVLVTSSGLKDGYHAGWQNSWLGTAIGDDVEFDFATSCFVAGDGVNIDPPVNRNEISKKVSMKYIFMGKPE